MPNDAPYIEEEYMLSKPTTITITVICLLVLGLPACKKEDDSQDETTAVLVLAAAALSQRPAFSFACNKSGTLGSCENNYGNTSQTQAQCVSAGGTVQTSKCSSSTSVGACTHTAATTSYVEKVYYSSNFTAGTAASNCTVLLGTFASTYTQ